MIIAKDHSYKSSIYGLRYSITRYYYLLLVYSLLKLFIIYFNKTLHVGAYTVHTV